MLRLILLSATLLLRSLYSFAQPQHPASGKLYDAEVVSRIDIQIEEDDLDFILFPDHSESNQLFPATFIFTHENTIDTVANIGFRLRGNTTRGAAKKAFKVSFNTFAEGRKYRGVEKLNLNPEKNDPTLSRSRICWELARQIGIPAARSNHVELYINGDYYGLYLNTEHIDETFVQKRFGNNDGNLYKCLFPADLVYRSNDPNAYKSVIYGRRAYDLKTNTDSDNYADLAAFIDVLNNTPTADLPCELERIFNVNDYLKAMAFDVLTGNWDGPLYNKNNFYLYHNTETDKFEYIPYDLDNTLGIDWLQRDWSERNIYRWGRTSEARPLFYNILAVEEYKNRYSYYLQQYMEQFFNTENLAYFLNELPEHLLPYVQRDAYYSLDFGFEKDNFMNSFTEEFESFHVDYSIKNFIEKRNEQTQSQLLINNIEPIISQLSANNFTGGNGIVLKAKVEDEVDLAQVEVCYHTGSTANETCVAMNAIEDNIYQVQIADFTAEQIFYHIRATDNRGNISQMPRCDDATTHFSRSNATLAINEFMASNESTVADEAGEFDDWVELYNYGNEAIFLGDKYLSDKPDNPTKWQMPEIMLEAGEYLLIWADEDGSQGDLHANFKLSAGGEFVGIFASDADENILIDGIEFGEQTTDVSFGRLPNGTGDFQTLSPTPNASNQPVHVNDLAHFAIDMTVAPNPFTTFLQLEINNPQRIDLQLEVIDILGRKVWQRDIGKFSISEQWRTTNWSNGLYQIILKTNQQIIFTDKMLKVN